MPVAGTANGLPLRATLVPAGKGRHRLFLNGETRKALGVGEGDPVAIDIRPDGTARARPMPPPFQKALDADADDRGRWEKMTPSLKKEIHAYLNRLKSREALERNVERTLRNRLVFYWRK